MEAAAIHPSLLEKAWPTLEPLVARVCKFGGEWNPSTVLLRCMNQSAWPNC